MKPELLIKKYDRQFYDNVERYLRNNGYVNIGMGGYRTAFMNNTGPWHSVIKIPRSQDGFDHNIREAYVYRKYRIKPDKHGVMYAPCRLLSNGCLLMSFVNYVSSEYLPSWAYDIDGYQVGKFKDRFVAYDSGCDISHADKISALEWADVEGK